MASVYNSGPMVPDTKVTGRIIELTERENSHTLMETFTTASGSTIRPMVLESTTTLMEQCMKDTGETTSSTEKEKRVGPMAQSTKASIWPVRSTV